MSTLAKLATLGLIAGMIWIGPHFTRERADPIWSNTSGQLTTVRPVARATSTSPAPLLRTLSATDWTRPDQHGRPPGRAQFDPSDQRSAQCGSTFAAPRSAGFITDRRNTHARCDAASLNHSSAYRVSPR